MAQVLTKPAEVMTQPTPAEASATTADLEKECESWAWVRAAGVSAQELRKAVEQSLRARKES